MRAGAIALAAVLAIAFAACKRKPKAEIVAAPIAMRGDAAHGKELVLQFECNRCHDATGFEAAPLEKHCVHCHQTIMAGTYEAPKATIEKWQKIIVNLRDAPSFVSTGARFRRGWIEQFLLSPRDLRPHMTATMPRLAIAPDQARDIATYLAPDDEKSAAFSAEDEARGKTLFAQKSCTTCHGFSGVP